MEQEILPAYIQDDGQTRTGLGYVGKVLLRPHTQINSVTNTKTPEAAQDLQIGRFVGNQIVRIKEAGILGKARNQPNIFRVRKTLGNLLGDSNRRGKPEE